MTMLIQVFVGSTDSIFGGVLNHIIAEIVFK